MKKIIYITLVVILIGFVLYAYNEFNGNLVSKYFSEHTLKKYLSEKYPEKELRVNEGTYNFKFKEYAYRVVEIGTVDAEKEPNEYEFNIRGFIMPKVHWDGIRESMLDQEVMDRLGAEGGTELSKLLKPNVPAVKEVEVHVEVLKGQLDTNASWSKDLPFDRPIQIYILLDANQMNKEEVYQTAQTIQKTLNDEGYTYESNINANQFGRTGKAAEHGALKYAVYFERDTKIKLGDVEEYNQ